MAIPREQVSLVSDDVAYAYGNLKYVVTTDGGKTWIQSDLFTRLENIQRAVIRNLTISGDGTGTLSVAPGVEQRFEYLIVHLSGVLGGNSRALLRSERYRICEKAPHRSTASLRTAELPREGTHIA